MENSTNMNENPPKRGSGMKIEKNEQKKSLNLKDYMIQSKNIIYSAKHVMIGLLVAAIGIWVPVLFLIFLPESIAIIAWVAYLILYVLFTSGRIGWKSTASVRAKRIRSGATKPQQYLLGICLALLLALIWHAMLMVLFRIIEFPYDLFMENTNYDGLPTWKIWLMIFIGAIGAGVYEEIGFRGYMQVPLEEKFGLFRAIMLTSIFFVLLHINQLYAPSVFIPLFIFSILAGMLAYATDSLIPVIISHILLDVFNFGYWWSDFFGRFNYQTIFAVGTDNHFWIWLSVLIIAVLSFIVLFKIALKVKTTNYENKDETN